MPLHHIYYSAKPYLPWRLRMALRRLYANRIRRNSTDRWPILQAAARKPEGWTGWPDGKQFALVLTHDVEGGGGVAKCRQLAEVEREFGFVSSFNFIPRGDYDVPQDLRHWLVRNGFEVGVHDLYHDGKLYRDFATFQKNAKLINAYLKKWDAIGFRSGFMHHNLEWIKQLDVAYDCSTFDTDPFEPQPDATHTIFPFWVEKSSNQCLVPDQASNGYVELPYTLPQDSTVFLLFQEKSIDIWKRKLQWIARNGGMAMLNVHPDYISFNGKLNEGREFPIAYYREFLNHLKTAYADQYWHALPREVAAQARLNPASRAPLRAFKIAASPRAQVWIDLDNTPHVPFFAPIIEELERRGLHCLVTARDAFQVRELAEAMGLSCRMIGRHSGKNRLKKVAGLFLRALQLVPPALRQRPLIAVSHGSRSQIIASNFLGIPTLLLADYEHAKYPPLMRPKWEMVPEIIPSESLYCPQERVRKYPGIKEDVYAWRLHPDPFMPQKLGITAPGLLITVRPPATEAHYHNPESEKLFVAFMNRACRESSTRIVLLPRNKKQGEAIRKQSPGWFEGGQTVIPSTAIDGLSLIWHSDLVVSGGGTMNREAAALNVPVYSIFRGPIGAVDRQLAKEGRLILIENERDVEEKIVLKKREKTPVEEVTSRAALLKIVDTIVELANKDGH